MTPKDETYENEDYTGPIEIIDPGTYDTQVKNSVLNPFNDPNSIRSVIIDVTENLQKRNYCWISWTLTPTIFRMDMWKRRSIFSSKIKHSWYQHNIQYPNFLFYLLQFYKLGLSISPQSRHDLTDNTTVHINIGRSDNTEVDASTNGEDSVILLGGNIQDLISLVKGEYHDKRTMSHAFFESFRVDIK